MNGSWWWALVLFLVFGLMSGCSEQPGGSGGKLDVGMDVGLEDVGEGDVKQGDVEQEDVGTSDVGKSDVGLLELEDVRNSDVQDEGDVEEGDVEERERPSVSRYGISMGWDALRWLSDEDLERTFAGLEDLGVGILRTDLSWDAIQPDGPDAYRWEKFDQVVDLAHARGIQMMPILHRSPNWARPAGTQRNELPDLDAFREFSRVAAERYAPRGIYYWMVWNEPNHQMFFSPPNPAAYAALLNAGYEGVKAGNPHAFVVSAGLSPAPATDLEGGRYVSAIEFARAMYQHEPKLDAFGFHPYGWPLPPTSTEGWQGWRMMEHLSDNLRRIMTEHGDGAKRIWLTEYGAPTSVVSESDQADFLASAYALAAEKDWIGPLFYYSFRDIGTNLNEPEHFYGLLRNDWSPKPGYARYKNLPRLENLR